MVELKLLEELAQKKAGLPPPSRSYKYKMVGTGLIPQPYYPNPLFCITRILIDNTHALTKSIAPTDILINFSWLSDSKPTNKHKKQRKRRIAVIPTQETSSVANDTTITYVVSTWKNGCWNIEHENITTNPIQSLICFLSSQKEMFFKDSESISIKIVSR